MTKGNPLDDKNTGKMYVSNVYFAGNDDEEKDNISKIYKNKAASTSVNAIDVKPGDVAIFVDGNGNISHSAIVTNVGKRGKGVRLDSKDDRNEIEGDLSKKDIIKGDKKLNKKNATIKRFVGYYRHNKNKEIDMKVQLMEIAVMLVHPMEN